MRIWVDADACPIIVRDMIIKTAIRLELETVLVANRLIQPPELPLFSAVRVDKGADVADQYIVAEARIGDLVITQDIPLAGELVGNGIVVISPYGTLFTPDNIGERLSVRNFLTDMRSQGGVTSGPRPFGPKEKQQFADALDRTLTRLRKRSSL